MANNRVAWLYMKNTQIFNALLKGRINEKTKFGENIWLDVVVVHLYGTFERSCFDTFNLVFYSALI